VALAVAAFVQLGQPDDELAAVLVARILGGGGGCGSSAGRPPGQLQLAADGELQELRSALGACSHGLLATACAAVDEELERRAVVT